MQENDNFLWVEKYRPHKIDDCILPDSLKETFKKFLSQGEIPNLLLSGTAGTGKTTVARALCEELGCDYIILNGSDEGRSIDTVRNNIKNFASTVSLSESGPKVVIIDEADYMNPESVQPALRNFIETFSKHCRFIFTCNFINKIIAPIHSRCTVITFRTEKKDKQKIAGSFHKRLKAILDNEKIDYDDKVLAELIIKHYPDFRRTINELQRYSVSGKIDTGILVSLSEQSFKDLAKLLKKKDFVTLRKWVIDNIDKDPNQLYKEIYSNLSEFVDPKTQPIMIMVLAKYMYQSAFVADQEINMIACLTEIMGECKFK
jgi:DNA polymerase III delta prime subunit|tara:strand:+ start:220 stop:1170 length:951 start_codon:yes stop_codon:yes gene_type:complete